MREADNRNIFNHHWPLVFGAAWLVGPAPEVQNKPPRLESTTRFQSLIVKRIAVLSRVLQQCFQLETFVLFLSLCHYNLACLVVGCAVTLNGKRVARTTVAQMFLAKAMAGKAMA